MSRIATRCSSPIGVYWPALCSYIYTRCRRCEGCLKARQWGWMARAAHEQVRAKKTWFVTLTYGPNRRRAVMAAASAEERTKAPGQRLVRAAGSYVAAYMKTLRKRGFEFRYVWVPELHRDGFPHFHGLVHDQRGDLTWAALTDAWSAGFSVVKLVRDARAIRYVTKYLAKDRIGRVRASFRYGAPLPGSEEGEERNEQGCDLQPPNDGGAATAMPRLDLDVSGIEGLVEGGEYDLDVNRERKDL